jgi:hypothetical protein
MVYWNTRGCQPKSMTSAKGNGQKAGNWRSVTSQLRPLPSSSPSSS